MNDWYHVAIYNSFAALHGCSRFAYGTYLYSFECVSLTHFCPLYQSLFFHMIDSNITMAIAQMQSVPNHPSPSHLNMAADQMKYISKDESNQAEQSSIFLTITNSIGSHAQIHTAQYIMQN